MTKQIRYRANPVISYQDEGSEGAVLYNPDSDQCVVVNEIGYVIWSYLDKPRTTGEIINLLVKNYSGVETEQAKEDLESFLKYLGKDYIDEIS